MSPDTFKQTIPTGQGKNFKQSRKIGIEQYQDNINKTGTKTGLTYGGMEKRGVNTSTKSIKVDTILMFNEASDQL